MGTGAVYKLACLYVLTMPMCPQPRSHAHLPICPRSQMPPVEHGVCVTTEVEGGLGLRTVVRVDMGDMGAAFGSRGGGGAMVAVEAG